MAKVLTFSTKYPSYHYRKNDPTFFIEKVLRGLYSSMPLMGEYFEKLNPDYELISQFRASIKHPMEFDPKYHTIRIGRRWKAGDMASLRVWSGKPYFSKQIIIAPDIEIKKVWDVEIWIELSCIYIGIRIDKNTHELLSFGEVAKNDGLTFEELQHWFNPKVGHPIVCQIICWSEEVNYD